METDNSCSICLDDKSNYALKICKHKFHKKCIKTWLKDHNCCPICRQHIDNTFRVWYVDKKTHYNAKLHIKDDTVELSFFCKKNHIYDIRNIKILRHMITNGCLVIENIYNHQENYCFLCFKKNNDSLTAFLLIKDKISSLFI